MSPQSTLPLYTVEEIAAHDTREWWNELARRYDLRRRPLHRVRATRGQMGRWCRLVGISAAAFCEWAGVKTFPDWIALNPRWPLYGAVGLMLECREWTEAQQAQKPATQG